MVEGELEMSIEVENMSEMLQKIEDFQHIELKQTIYRSNQKTANMVEKQLKALRRSFYADATFNPLGIVFGSLDPKAIYVAYPHGTWAGNFWETFKRRIVPQIIDRMEKAIERAIKKFNLGEG